ncbi:hypothetical protein [Halarchaeum nitratireducens]|nr:hypothetical protein [Halarchaeum nitratireducens]
MRAGRTRAVGSRVPARRYLGKWADGVRRRCPSLSRRLRVV